MVNPNHLSEEQAPIQETVARLEAMLQYVDWETLIEGVEPDAESTPTETVYPIENPVGTTDEIAVVKYTGLEDAHKHIGDETEAHVPLEGAALYFIDGKPVPVAAGGQSQVIVPGTPHFAVASEEFPYTTFVVSSPGFDPEHMVPLSAEDPRDVATLEQYDKYNALQSPAA